VCVRVVSVCVVLCESQKKFNRHYSSHRRAGPIRHSLLLHMVLLTNTKDVRARCRTYQISPAWVAPREGRPARSPRREGVMTQRSIVRLREEGRAAREGKAPAAPCCRQGEGRAAAPGRREAAPPAGEE
jgi:hypothetical protein